MKCDAEIIVSNCKSCDTMQEFIWTTDNQIILKNKQM